MKFIASVSLIVLLSNAYAAAPEEWKGFSEPETFGDNFNFTYSDLPLEGSILDGTKAWSGDYWASQKGGINYRWNARSKVGFDYSSPTKEQVQKMSLDELAALAPTEKYDLFLGNYSYPLKKEATGTASKKAKDWAGICHGWAPASIFHNEPTPKVMSNPDGIQIPFGSADIKALISYFYAFHHEAGAGQIGLRCFFGSGWLSGAARACKEDLNAGAFHVVIANRLGILKQGFMVDVDRYKEVWNQPAVGYKSMVVNNNLKPSSGAAKGTVKEIRISTEFFYVDESDPTWDVVHGTDNQVIAKRDLQYRIELDSKGKIIGGAWESMERPDFLWDKRPAAPEDFTGLMSALPKLLND